jgi:copper chaperone CopZ
MTPFSSARRTEPLRLSPANRFALAAGLLLLAVGGPWLVRQFASLPRPAALAARSSARIVTLEIGGMTCEGCAKSVQAQLIAVAGVSTAEVRLDQRRAYVVCDPAVDDTTLIAAVERPGPAYTASVVSR